MHSPDDTSTKAGRHAPPRSAATLLLAGVAGFLLVYLSCKPWDLRDGTMIGAPLGRDFVNFWLGGRLALDGSLATLADLPAYGALVAHRFGHTARDPFLFSYPPHILLALAPLAALPYGAALAVWTTVNLAALAAAARAIGINRGMALAACLSPAALTMVMYGHFGGLLALALAGIVVAGRHRPLIAGLCLAALSVKPQLALAVGLVLLGAGWWRCLIAGAGATALLLAASVAAFGLDPWRGFLDVTLPEQARMLAELDLGMLGTTISPYLGLRVLGLPASAAAAAQLAVSAVAVALAARALRCDAKAPAFLALALGAVLSLPYANAYDLAVAAPALTPLVLAEEVGGWAALARLVAFLTPPLAWHLVHLGVPLLAPAVAATMAAGTPSRAARPAQARLAA